MVLDNNTIIERIGRLQAALEENSKREYKTLDNAIEAMLRCRDNLYGASHERLRTLFKEEHLSVSPQALEYITKICHGEKVEKLVEETQGKKKLYLRGPSAPLWQEGSSNFDNATKVYEGN